MNDRTEPERIANTKRSIKMKRAAENRESAERTGTGAETRSKVILVTAFEPFGEDLINPTQMILEQLPDEVGGYEIRKLLLPVEFVRSRELACAEYDRVLPSAVVMLGQAGSRSAITPETTGRNIMSARIPDNAGYQPLDLPVAENGPEALHSTFPADRIVDAVKGLDIPCERSDDAGTYVCNSLLYSMLEHNRGEVPTGFIHVPFIPEQGHEDKPFMKQEDIYEGIAAALRAIIDP